MPYLLRCQHVEAFEDARYVFIQDPYFGLNDYEISPRRKYLHKTIELLTIGIISCSSQTPQLIILAQN